MNWQTAGAVRGRRETETQNKREGGTMWRADEGNGGRFWRVTADREGMAVVPANDLNHPRSKRAAKELWYEDQDKAAYRERDPHGDFSPGRNGLHY